MYTHNSISRVRPSLHVCRRACLAANLKQNGILCVLILNHILILIIQ